MVSRNTDADWVAIADSEPFFGVLANPMFLADNLNDAAIDEFYRSGVSDVAHAVAIVRRHLDDSFKPQHAVDFGCGVGRLSFAMREYTEQVTGVDVAPAMRSRADERRDRLGITGVTFAAELPESGVDWINSLIVFQHIPPARGYSLAERLLNSLNPGGIASLHFTTHRDQRHMHELLRDVLVARYDGEQMQVLEERDHADSGQMSMFDYDLGRLLALFTRKGMGGIWLEPTDHAGVHGCWIFGRRG